MRGNLYQLVLIALAILVTALFGVFLYRELTPEYKLYQNDYIALEKFRSTYTGEPPPPFQEGIKQIVLPNKNKGPDEIDRCISCHVALKFEHFSPTKIAYDVNGQIEYDAQGFPKKTPNENYIWAKLNEKIKSLRDPAANKKLEEEGKGSEVTKRLAQADTYEGLKTVEVDGHIYDVEIALQMHPLIGRETRPFELHPIEEYGCVSCHGGNGRGLTTEKAHGPVFDGTYEIEDMGPTPVFLEEDEKNAPRFSKVFNHKPGHTLLFQTTPILVGHLMEAKCVQCHNSSHGSIEQAYRTANQSIEQREHNIGTIASAYTEEINALISLVDLQNSINKQGFQNTLASLESKQSDSDLPPEEQKKARTQYNLLKKSQTKPEQAELSIHNALIKMVGSDSLLNELSKQLAAAKGTKNQVVQNFIAENKGDGSLFAKAKAIASSHVAMQQIYATKRNFSSLLNNKPSINSPIDHLTKDYQRGEELFISQACYACHRIEGLARGGIGPDLTEEGKKYPWFIKESIVWPQADLKTSTMPNFHLDHDELEDLTTFLLAQTGQRLYESPTAHKIAIAEWEAGKKRAWEEPLKPSQIHNLDDAMEIFATEGCASCHRLKGFQSNVGFVVEKDKNVSYATLHQEKEWFSKLFPEDVSGSNIVQTIETHKDEINKRIADNVRSNSLLEKLQAKDPQSVAQFYSNFKYAFRGKDSDFQTKDATAEQEKKAWNDIVRKVMMIYVQEYGLGRVIGPRPNWSGVYRSDKWLMEHFFNPAAVVRRSIMPVMPFDTTKFYALTYMLDVLGMRNRDELRRLWEYEGFSPEKSYQTLCAQCHGEYLQGNGPVSEWIYPIPKNLRSADFLRNLTKEKAYESIVHGILGTPMPPWGETSKDKPMPDDHPVLTLSEIVQIVDWLFSSLPGGSVIKNSEEVPKWQYTPENAIEELKRERSQLKALPEKPEKAVSPLSILSNSQEIDNYYASLTPKVQVAPKMGQEVADIFDEVPHSSADPTIKNYYYIKKKYYTPENLEKGKEFFEINCSICHGREADGSGNRASAMVEAKPRMLTNLAWLESKDDLRLLRSIKYGVPGTSMVAWGDQTTSLQRLQLVMFIRSLSDEAKTRDDLMSHIYDTFNSAQYTLEKYRIALSPQMTELEQKLKTTNQNLLTSQALAEQNKSSPEESVKLYQQKLTEEQSLKKLEDKDVQLQNIITQINNEKQTLVDLGLSIIAQQESDIDLKKFFQLIDLLKGNYSIDNDTLAYKPVDPAQLKALTNDLKEEVDKQIIQLNQQKFILTGKIASTKVNDEIQAIAARENSLKSLKNKISTFFIQTLESQKIQQELVEKFNKELNNLSHDTSKA